MVLTPGALRAILAAWFCVLAAIWVMAWLAPGIGLSYDDAAYLVAAKSLAAGHGYAIANLPAPVAETRFPPVFPALLSLFTLVSGNAQWLKLLPALSGIAWLYLTGRLLVRMGASAEAAWFLIGLTAASPMVIFLATNLMAETLFALLVTATLLCLIDERALPAGVLAGLATLTMSQGAPLIAACILILVARARLRTALIFAATSMLVVAPWFGWAMAHPGFTASNIFTGLAANEKAVVLARNFFDLFAAPYSLLTGFGNMFSIGATAFVFGWSLFVRRQFVPDLFVLLYCLTLLCLTRPPERAMAPILPLLLWIVWRVFRMMELREALAAAVAIAAVLAVWAGASRIPNARAGGYFTSTGRETDNWREMQKLFAYVRAGTQPESVVLADLDPLIYLSTGRRVVRGFEPNNFTAFYGAGQAVVTPDQLSNQIAQSNVSYVVLTPDRDLPESSSFRSSVLALERGGVLEPVPIPNLAPQYRLLRVTR